MVLLLNYMPVAVVAFFLYLAYRNLMKDHWGRMWVMVVLAIFVPMALVALSNSSYLPRGTVDRLPSPEFEESSAGMVDRMRAPERVGDEAAEHLKELSDWRKHKQEREEKQQ